MNIFLPQSNQTRIELEDIADVQRQIITPALSVPIIGIVQDGLIGGYNLTQPTMKIDWKSAMNIISYTTIDDFSAFKKDSEISGSDLFSLIIPSRINNSGNFEVKNGKIMKGFLSAQMLGAKKPHNLIHMIWDEYGYEETKKFLDNTQRLVNNFNLWNCFSVGIGDIDISKEVEQEINKAIETKKLEINHLITEMENNPDLIPMDVFEDTIKAELDAVRPNTATKIITANLKPDNGFGRMVWAGSKGNPDNIGQMGGCLGQQAVEGKRIQKKYNGRALPYLHQNDDSAIGRGFVEQPFYTGIHPLGYIFHDMGSREGLIDTAIKSVTGDTPIIILEDDKPMRVMIGDWIDKQLEKSPDKVEHYTEREMELLKLTNKVYIPTSDEKGNVSWGEISAITRHDPGKELYEIKTHGGRQVIVTESKSLLIWNPESEEFERMSTPDVKVGNFVPVTIKLNIPPIINGNVSDIDDTLEINNLLNLLIAPKNIIKAFVNKYISNINEIEFDTEEISCMFGMLLTRVGIYTKLCGNKLIIESNKVLNNVVLDTIVEINKIDIAKYPKVYDLTVPSTLNFGLANGLHVVDTAESGYVQRKLIKSMEDISIKYDSTVRNSNNTIIQFIYGDSGIDTIKQSQHNLNMLEMSNSTIATKIKFTEQELKNFKFSANDNIKHYKEFLELRNMIRNSRMLLAENNITFENGFMLPVNYKAVVTNIKNSDMKDEGVLEPSYILEKLESVIDYSNTKVTSLTSDEYKNKKSLRHRDEMLSKGVLRFALYEYLSPKICIFEHGLKKTKFDSICDKIINIFNNAVVQPGEMVGIIAAQSIGEPTTQIFRSLRS